jgi:pimeloyl-ACP methyl ester carboxylesterase
LRYVLTVSKKFVLGLWMALAVSVVFEARAAAAPAQGWRQVSIPSTGSYFFRYVPASLDTSRPVPVVLFFHGSGTKPFNYLNFVLDAAEQARCVVALPKSAAESGWGTGNDDQTVAETLRLLGTEMSIDPAHIAVAGHSAGGAYAYLLAYTTRSGYSAVFSLAAHFYAVAAVADPDYKAPIRMFYGTADPNYTGGSYAALKQQWIHLGVPWEEDIRPGLLHGDLPPDAMAAGFQFLASKSYPVKNAPGPCVAAPGTLCLGNGRYRLEVAWRDFQNNTGIGTAMPLSEESGLFWFFAPENIEALVKVLDGCAVTGHHWVFAAATTNVEYTLTVTDTTTGAVAVYRNPLGRSSPAVTDTMAPLPCP